MRIATRPASLQRGLGEIAEEDATATTRTTATCSRFNEASARSPRKTWGERAPRRARSGFNEASARSPRKTCLRRWHAGHVRCASTRPRRDRRGRHEAMAAMGPRWNRLQRGLGEIAEEDSGRGGAPSAGAAGFNEASARSPRKTGVFVSIPSVSDTLQRGLGEIAEEDRPLRKPLIFDATTLCVAKARRGATARTDTTRPRATRSTVHHWFD